MSINDAWVQESMRKEMITNADRQRLKDAVGEAEKALSRAEAIADEIGEGFSWSPAYGMGGYYTPMRMTKATAVKILEHGEYENLSAEKKKIIVAALKEEDHEYNEPGWRSSSQNC